MGLFGKKKTADKWHDKAKELIKKAEFDKGIIYSDEVI